jgi:hypothetical protein
MTPPAPLVFGSLEMWPEERKLVVDGVSHNPGARTFDLLLLLIENRDRVVGKAKIFARQPADGQAGAQLLPAGDGRERRGQRPHRDAFLKARPARLFLMDRGSIPSRRQEFGSDTGLAAGLQESVHGRAHPLSRKPVLGRRGVLATGRELDAGASAGGI